jgi:hypothetical protein
MERSGYNTVPAHDPLKPSSLQDARSGAAARPASSPGVQPAHLAIQPAANAGSLKLKKKAVKIVTHPATASATSSVASRVTTPTAAPTPVSPATATIAAPEPSQQETESTDK